tara:strand:+ start:377 stop:526 length:150 start_codon:yes stop_codon:yes gene_type:complete
MRRFNSWGTVIVVREKFLLFMCFLWKSSVSGNATNAVDSGEYHLPDRYA